MHLAEMFTLALALAMDAFAVSLGLGVKMKRVSARQTFRLAWHFGFFQAGMPVVGWMAGGTIREHFAAFDHWIAFGLLFIIGVKMIKEAFEFDDKILHQDPSKGMSLVALSIATSIDALAVGFSFSVLGISIWMPIVIIGAVACTLTLGGLYLGCKAIQIVRLGPIAEVLGGLVLIGIGTKILIAHGVL
jgi:putative Mn2+ efflux pump MntP